MHAAPITVVIPLHNKASHVLQTFQSIASQEQPVAEIVVVDDASTDGSADLVQSLNLPHVTLLSRTVPGPGGYAARNLGIQAASHDWVAFLDADDTWEPGYIRSIAGMIRQAPSDVGCVFTGFVNEFSYARRVNAYAARRVGVHQLDFDEFVDGWLAARDCPIWTGAVAFRRSVLLDAGLFPDRRCRRGGDKDLWLRAMAGANALCDPRPLATYHREADNMVTKNVTMARRHCMCDTLVEMIAAAPPERARRLKRLYNLETRAYAFQSLRRGAVPPEVIEGYYRDEDFTRWLFYRAVSLVPSGALRQMVDAQRTLKNSVRRFAGR